MIWGHRFYSMVFSLLFILLFESRKYFYSLRFYCYRTSCGFFIFPPNIIPNSRLTTCSKYLISSALKASLATRLSFRAASLNSDHVTKICALAFSSWTTLARSRERDGFRRTEKRSRSTQCCRNKRRKFRRP